MKKLEQGDYVKELTEKQFKQLMELQPEDYLPYIYEDEKSGICFSKNGFLIILRLSEEGEATNPISFDEFKQRAINTFKSC